MEPRNTQTILDTIGRTPLVALGHLACQSAHLFSNLQQKLQQNEGGRYWRMVADSD